MGWPRAEVAGQASGGRGEERVGGDLRRGGGALGGIPVAGSGTRLLWGLRFAAEISLV